MKLSDLMAAVPDLSSLHEDYAVNAAVTLPDFNPRYTKVVGTMDGLDVWLTRFFGEDYNTFAFRNGEELLAFVVVGSTPLQDAYPLVRMWSAPNHRGRGLTTALVMFMTKKLNTRLVIRDDEPLTDEGWNWLIKAVQRNKVKAINAATGAALTADDIKSDKMKQRSTGAKTDLSVIIERDVSRYDLFGSGGHRQLNEVVYVVDGKEGLD